MSRLRVHNFTDLDENGKKDLLRNLFEHSSQETRRDLSPDKIISGYTLFLADLGMNENRQ